MMKREQGFTIIELIVSISIFIVILTVSMGAILGIFDSNRKSRALRSVMSNLNLAMESMSKEMRYGSNYHCGNSGTLTEPQNCSSGDNLLSFLSSEGDQITYRLNGTILEKDINEEGYYPVTAPEVFIDDLDFYTSGAISGDLLQPKIIILLRGHAGNVGKGESKFDLQTLVSQRTLDL